MGAQPREFNEGNIDTVALAYGNPLGMWLLRPVDASSRVSMLSPV